MILVILLDLIVVGSLLSINSRKGFEQTFPLAAFFLMVFPEESKLPILGLFDITTQRLVTLVLIALAMTAGGQSEGIPRKVPLKGWLIAIGAWWTLSTLDSITFMDSFKALLSLFLDYLAIYVLFAKYISRVETVQRILFGIAAGLVVCSVFGVIEAYANWSVVALFPTEIHRFGASGALYMDDARGMRIQSTFGHPILFGSALAMGIPMVMHLLSGAVSRSQRLFLWAGLLFMFASIFKTSSRGPWMALGFSLVPFVFLGERRVRKYILTICLLAAIVLIARPGVWETVYNDYLSTVDTHSSQGESYQYRYELYALVIARLGESPLRQIWGYGPQSFPALHLVGTINGRWMSFVSCDSSIAALLVETGYVGLGLMGTFLLYVMFRTFRGFLAIPHPADQVCMLFFVNLSAFYFEMTNVAILGWGQQVILLWIIIAMIVVYPSLYESEAQLDVEVNVEPLGMDDPALDHLPASSRYVAFT